MQGYIGMNLTECLRPVMAGYASGFVMRCVYMCRCVYGGAFFRFNHPSYCRIGNAVANVVTVGLFFFTGCFLGFALCRRISSFGRRSIAYGTR